MTSIERIKNEIKSPGLTSGTGKIQRLAIELPKRFSVLAYKHAMPYLWVAFVGGTGTGKSTLFNALCGRQLSETGVERPKTCGPIAYAHKNIRIEESFPFDIIQIDRRSSEDFQSLPATGTPGRLILLAHSRNDWPHLILIDTPDLDSVELENRHITEELSLMSDAIVFVTSEEKYADEVPSLFLKSVIEENKPYYFIFNKVQERFSRDDLIETYLGHNLPFDKDRIWIISYEPSNTMERIGEQSSFQNFMLTFLQELSTVKLDSLRKTQFANDVQNLKSRLDDLLCLLEEENQECQHWFHQLNDFHQKICQELIKDEKARFMAKSQEYLQIEIRNLFSRYDVLAGPRQFIREIFLIPLRFLGIRKKHTEKSQKNDLMKVMRKTDLAPLQRAIDKLNRLVFKNLSPEDERSPIFKKLREPEVVLKDDEIRERIFLAQERLALWMEKTFMELSRGIPKSKQLGIYSTSILWGIMVVSFEIVVGGGFSVLDAALDSVLAPFITKGAVELFAYVEIQKIAQELAKRYQEGLLSVLHLQRDRYENCLRSLMTGDETMKTLKGVDSEIENLARSAHNWNSGIME